MNRTARKMRRQLARGKRTTGRSGCWDWLFGLVIWAVAVIVTAVLP